MKSFFTITFATILIVAMLICVPANSSATWSQQFNEAGVGPFDRLEVFMTSADDFFTAPFTGFTNAGWTSTVVNPEYVVATGQAVETLNFNINFDNGNADPLDFDFLAFYGDVNLEAAHASWSGSGWTITKFAYDQNADSYNRAPVPEPATMLLLGSGLVGLAGFGRKKLFKR